MIIKPTVTYSDSQREHALNCVVSRDGDRVLIWNPETSTQHYIIDYHCDCVGYEIHGKCYHLLAVELWEQRNEGMTAEKAISELFG